MRGQYERLLAEFPHSRGSKRNWGAFIEGIWKIYKSGMNYAPLFSTEWSLEPRSDWWRQSDKATTHYLSHIIGVKRRSKLKTSTQIRISNLKQWSESILLYSYKCMSYLSKVERASNQIGWFICWWIFLRIPISFLVFGRTYCVLVNWRWYMSQNIPILNCW